MSAIDLTTDSTTEATTAERPSAEEHAAAMADYLAAGRQRAIALGNRGPLRLTGTGALHPDILAAYQEHGFYVFENLINEAELAELRAGIDEMIDRAPAHPGAELDRHGQPAMDRHRRDQRECHH